MCNIISSHAWEKNRKYNWIYLSVNSNSVWRSGQSGWLMNPESRVQIPTHLISYYHKEYITVNHINFYLIKITNVDRRI